MIDDGTTVRLLDPSVRDLAWVESLVVFSGGAFTGAYHVRALRETDAAAGPGTLVAGTSVGALAALAYACGRPDLYETLFASLDDRHAWDGVEGIMAPRAAGLRAWWLAFLELLRGNDWRKALPTGLVSLDPLKDTIRANLRPEDVRRPYAVGVVSKATDRHYVCVLGPDTPWDLQVDLVVASCAMAAICEPLSVALLPEYQHHREVLVDGGHHSLVPLPPLSALPRLRSVVAVFTAPSASPSNSEADGLLGSLGWAVARAMRAALKGDLAELAAWRSAGVDVRVGLPSSRSYGFMDASREAFEARLAESDRIWDSLSG